MPKPEDAQIIQIAEKDNNLFEFLGEESENMADNQEAFEKEKSRLSKKTVTEGQGAIAAGESGLQAAQESGLGLGLKKSEVSQIVSETRANQDMEKTNELIVALAEETLANLEKTDRPETGVETLALEKSFLTKEAAYLEMKLESAPGLNERYEDERGDVRPFLTQASEYINRCGLERRADESLKNKVFNAETKTVIKNRIGHDLKALLLNKESGRFNPEKYAVLKEQTERFLDLIEQAQMEGNLASSLKAEDAAKLIDRNIDLIAFQDRVAAENMLGDHGIRHIVGFNIKKTEKILDSLVNSGQEVKAIDRLMGHQIMLMHDLGYASTPIREEINRKNFPADKGHNLLSAKLTRQMALEPDSPLSAVFPSQYMEIIHQGVLEHDDSQINFQVKEKGEKVRRENLISAVRLADNTHAFEDKLPELLYAVPESLKAMRILKAAGETNNHEMAEMAKKSLIGAIKNSGRYSPDDQDALIQAVDSLNEQSYRFSVPRICGNKPEISIDQNGRANIKVQESAIHREVVGIFGQDAHKQLKKFIKDLGVELNESEILNTSKIEGKRVTIELAIDDNKAQESTSYQRRIEEMITDKDFVSFSRKDLVLSRRQTALEKRLEALDETPEPTIQTELKKTLERYKKLRHELYKNYEKLGEKTYARISFPKAD